MEEIISRLVGNENNELVAALKTNTLSHVKASTHPHTDGMFIGIS